ncbi:MAG: hydrogenase formation protein HypD [Clostridiaceae bacterium]
MRGKNNVIKEMLSRINEFNEEINIIELSSVHTADVEKYLLKDILNNNINIISVSGCPITLIPAFYIDYLFNLSLKEDVIILAYSDLLKIPGSTPDITLGKAKDKGANIRVIFSSIDAINIALHNHTKKVVFIASGFETNIGSSVIAIKEAETIGLDNFFIFSLHRNMEGIIRYFLENQNKKIDGLILPGNFSLVMGEEGYDFLNSYELPSVITGFSFLDILSSIEIIVNQKINGTGQLVNNYNLPMPYEGNKIAKGYIKEYFDIDDDFNRALGKVPGSVYRLKKKFDKYNIDKIYPLEEYISKLSIDSSNNEQCEKVMKGAILPLECLCFKKQCTRLNPIGPTMASSEGICFVVSKYT